MKTKYLQLRKISMVVLILLFSAKIAVAQVDTTVKQNVPATETTKEEPKKKSSSFIGYGSVTFNKLSMSTAYESPSAVGWALGVAYRRGNFFYWQVGARYNSASYQVNVTGQPTTTNNSISVTDIDIPINVGINLLSVTKKLLGLRVFVGAVPAFLTSVGTSDYPNLNKGNSNSFNFYGQGGVGVDVLFLLVEAGYNFGTTDVFKTVQSKPGQGFVTLGFRF